MSGSPHALPVLFGLKSRPMNVPSSAQLSKIKWRIRQTQQRHLLQIEFFAAGSGGLHRRHSQWSPMYGALGTTADATGRSRGGFSRCTHPREPSPPVLTPVAKAPCDSFNGRA